jgi:hypothetical protein
MAAPVMDVVDEDKGHSDAFLNPMKVAELRRMTARCWLI